MSCPLKKSWKLRWRRALPAACQFNLRLVAACVLAVGPSGMEVFASATVSFVWMTLRPPKHHYIATASTLALVAVRTALLFHSEPHPAGHPQAFSIVQVQADDRVGRFAACN